MRQINIETISNYLSQILDNGIDLTMDSIDELQTQGEKELAYGLICLSEDLAFYKKRTEKSITNLKSTLFDSTIIAITDSKGIIKQVNQQFEMLAGYTESELIHSPLNLLDSNNHDSTFYGRIREAIESENIWQGEIRSTNKSGNFFWVNSQIFPIRNESGIIFEYWAICQDITSKKNTEDELNKALKAKDYLMKEMHHRIKNNLQLLISMLRLMKGGVSTNENGVVKDIIGRINSISSVHEIFYQKIENDSINLIEYLEKTFTKERTGVASATNFTIIGDEYMIKIEPCTYIGIVVNELITNSIKYAWKDSGIEDSEIKIEYKLSKSHLYFDYHDNGSGFNPKTVKSGLGTTLVELLVKEQLTGELEINSVNGNHVQLQIPIQSI